jgi:maleamate amidohydrolase
MSSDFEDHCWKDLVDQEILEIYESYHRETFIGPNPALLVIDLYNRAYAGGPGPVAEANRKSPGACGDNAWNAITPTVQVIAAARKAGIPVAYCTGSVRDGRIQSTFRSETERRPEADDLEIKQEFAPQPGDIVVRKERASAFYGTPLSAQLRMLGVQSLIAFGESTSGCVRASVVDGYSDGFKMTVAEECTFDRSWLSHKVNLFDLHHKYADVMHVEQILAHLEELAAAR